MIPDHLSHLPINRIQWLHRDQLEPNEYNPNKVFKPELELLITSILEDTWTTPIVVLPCNEQGKHDIVDGFHRYTVSADPRVMEVYKGYVPVIIINADPVHRRMSTIRHNRARGQHGVLPMAHIVQGMSAEGLSNEEIMQRLGMEKEELVRLLDRAGMPQRALRGDSGGFGSEWVPTSAPVQT